MSVPIDKTLEEIRTDTFNHIDEVQDDYIAKGWMPATASMNKGVFRGMIELFCWGLHQLYLFMATVLLMAFPLLAEKKWLVLHAGQVNLTRKAATKAKHTIYFTRTDTTGNVPIAAGRVVKTKPDGQGNVYRFITQADVVLLDGATEAAAEVEAEEYGQGSNVTFGQISEIATTIPGVDGVENRAGSLITEGADEETDAQLQERYRLQWMGNNGVTKYAYMAWALSVEGVIAVEVLDQHPRGQGTVDVVIKSSAGIPTQTLIDKVDAAVAGEEPVNDDYLVKGPTASNVTINAELVLTHGDETAILAEAENRLRALFEDPSQVAGVTALAIGQDLTMDLLIATLKAVDGVKSINWTSPVTDTAIAADGLAVLQSLTLTAVWATEA